MADIRRSVLDLFQQGVDAVSSAVHHVSDATRNKLDELTLQDQRKKLLEALANSVYVAWQQGLELPKELTDMLARLQEVDEQLKALVKQEEKAQATESGPEEKAHADEPSQATQAEETTSVPTINVADKAPSSDADGTPDPARDSNPFTSMKDEAADKP